MFIHIHCCLGDVWVRVRKTIVQTDGDGRAGAHCEYNQGILVDQPQEPLMAIMPLAMAIIAHVEYGHSLVVLLSYNIWDGGAGPAGRGHDHRYWRAQGWLPPRRLPSQPRPGRSLRSLHRTTIKSHLSVIGTGMCCNVIKSYKGINPSLSLAWVCRVSGFLIFCVQQKNTSVIITHKQTFHGHSVFSAPVNYTTQTEW